MKGDYQNFGTSVKFIATLYIPIKHTSYGDAIMILITGL